MSLCFRTLPTKFSSFVNTRKQITKFDRQLPKHIRSSPFLEEFLDTQTTTSGTSSLRENSSNTLCQNLLTSSSHDSVGELPEILTKTYDCIKDDLTWPRQRPTSIQIPGVIYSYNVDALMANTAMVDSNVRWTDPFLKCSSYNSNDETESLIFNTDTTKSLYDTYLKSDFERHAIYSVDSVVQSNEIQQQQQQQSEERSSNKPSEAQLQKIYDALSVELPQFFSKPFNCGIYTEDIVFVNNIKGTVTTGISKYQKQAAVLKAVGHMKYAYIKFDVLKMTVHPEDDSIKVRWRIKGISGLKVFGSIWRLSIRKNTKMIDSGESWYDGFSTFYVNNNGLIFKHVADKMMPDQSVRFEDEKTAIAPKLALFTALIGIDAYRLDGLSSEFVSQLQLSCID